jgi:acyl-CoA dehydrogenase
MTKTLLHQEWAMDLDAAIEAEAQAQAICMQTPTFVAPTMRSSRRRSRSSRETRRSPQAMDSMPTRAGIDRSHLEWPFFGDSHRALAKDLDAWAATSLPVGEHAGDHADVDGRCRELVSALGRGGFLRYCVPASHGGALPALDSRALCIARETLAYHDGLADFAFALQGLGSGAIALAGDDAQKARWLPAVAQGKAIAAFALSEPRRRVRRGGDDDARGARRRRLGARRLQDRGSRTAASPTSTASSRARAKERVPAASRRSSCRRSNPGLEVAERIEIIAPHPLARLEFEACRRAPDALLGTEGEGMKLALRTLDIFRAPPSPRRRSAFARRAADEALARARERPMFGGTLADTQLAQTALAEMALCDRRGGVAHVSAPHGCATSRARGRRRRRRSPNGRPLNPRRK